MMQYNLLAIGGFSDNSFRIINHLQQKHQQYHFHKKLVTCVAYSHKLKLLACGSRDCRVSVWKVSEKKGEIDSPEP